jgi:hypothetical protein
LVNELLIAAGLYRARNILSRQNGVAPAINRSPLEAEQMAHRYRPSRTVSPGSTVQKRGAHGLQNFF